MRGSAPVGPRLGQVGRPDRVPPVILEIFGRRAVAAPLVAVALPALGVLVQLRALLDALLARGYLLGDLDLFGLCVLERVGKGLDVVRHRPHLFLRQGVLPWRHRRTGESFRHGFEDILVERRVAGWREAELVGAGREIAGAGNLVSRPRTVAGPLLAVAPGAVLVVDILSFASRRLVHCGLLGRFLGVRGRGEEDGYEDGKPQRAQAPAGEDLLRHWIFRPPDHGLFPPAGLVPREFVHEEDDLPDLLLGEDRLPRRH